MSAPVWRIELLGSLCARRGEQVITRFRTQKTGALLAYLACHANRTARREEVIDLLWPENDLESGRNCLRIALSALRQMLEPDDSDRGAILLADRTHVQLNPTAYTTDKAEFEVCLSLATRSQDDNERITLLKQASALYRSDLLPGYDEAWIIGERQRLADAHLMALRRLIKILAKTHQYDEALDYARRAVTADPLREESHRFLMQLYGAMGRPGEAARQYREMERVFTEELGVMPSADTRKLAAQYLASESAPPRTESAVAVMEAALPFPSTPPPRPHFAPPSRSHGSVPLPATRFFGREDALADVLEMLDTPETRLITLTGLGGSGKTRLAVAVAERSREAFADAVWFVPLAQLTEANLIVDEIVKALSLPRVVGIAPLDQVAEFIGERPGLLVLDNFEHLAEQGAIIVRTLLDRAPGLICLVTSRQRLNLSGEYEYAVQPLSTPHMAGTPERLMEFASVQLFVDRAQALRPGFEVNRQNAAAIAAVCHHLEGIPLALELAAAYAQALTPQQILARLSPRFSLLVNRNKDAAPRHRSLRAALDWSYELLEPETRQFFARMGVFRGGWSLEAAEAVGADPMALEHLMQLRERSLLSVEEFGFEMRYGFLETVREYADEQLGENRESARCAHAGFFLQLAEEAETHLRGADTLEWLERLDREHDNIRAALHWAHAQSETQGDYETLLRLTSAMWRYWYLRGYQNEGQDWLEKALRFADAAPIPQKLKALAGAGNIAYNRGDYAAAQDWFAERLALAQQLGDRYQIAAAQGSLGLVAKDQGDFALARSRFTECLETFRGLRDQRGIALTTFNLANVATDAGDYRVAQGLYRESLTLFRKNEDLHNMLLALNNMASATALSGDDEAAHRLLVECLSYCRKLNSAWSLALCLEGFGALAVRQRQMKRAALLLGKAAALREEYQRPLQPTALEEYERDCARIREALEASLFEDLWTQGREMTQEQAMRLADEHRTPALV